MTDPRRNTLLLDRAAWDLVLDANGDIAMARPEYAVAQDVASALKLFRNELWYGRERGIPYWQDVLGKMPPAPVVIRHWEHAALTVPGTHRARARVTQFQGREVRGEVRVIDAVNRDHVVEFGG